MPASFAARRTPPKIPRPYPAPLTTSPIIEKIRAGLKAGGREAGTALAELDGIVRAGTPLIEAVPGNTDEQIVTFLHRDESADNVLLFVNRITDEKNLEDSLMQRVGTSTFRTLSYRMKRDWRASYCFLTSYPGQRPPWATEGDPVKLWSALKHGNADTYNPARCLNGEGKIMSVVELDRAPQQKHLPALEKLAQPGEVDWQLAPHNRLVARVGIGKPGPSAPTLLVFDGETWLAMGLLLMLDSAWAAGDISSLNLVLIHSGGRETRWRELDGTAPIADYLADELLPWLGRQGIVSSPQDTLLCGQSLGGLSALLSVLDRPESFGGVISQSASLWQPMALNRLRELVDSGQSGRLAHLTLDIQVGSQEWVLEPLHRDFIDKLKHTDAAVDFTVYNGGHDYACWRGGLISALERILCPLTKEIP